MANDKINIQLCGFGGQGIVLSAVILGTTAVTKADLFAVQTQSYGSEARGGECQAEVIISQKQIASPTADQVDLLAAMSRQAMEKYISRLRPGGTLVYDPEFVEPPDRSDIKAAQVPATSTAESLGVKLAANMVLLGFLQRGLKLFGENELLEVIADNVPQKFVDVNLEAARRGMALAEESGFKLEPR